MGWREQLQKGTFRGVPFEIESDDASFGRRVQTHEYPLRDLPFSEDLGRKARSKTLNVFVIGDDYMAKRDALLGALEQQGKGELVHPYYGRMMVQVTEFSINHSFQDGGMCRFSISFIESGELNYPSPNQTTAQQTLLSSDSLQTVTEIDFEDSFSVDNLSDFAVSDSVSNWTDIFDTLDSNLSNIGGILSDPLALIKSDITNLVRDPAALASRVFGLFSKSEAILTAASGIKDFDALNLLRVFGLTSLISQFQHDSSTAATATRTHMLINKNASNALVRRALITQAAGSIARMNLPVYDDAVTLKDSLLGAIDNESAQSSDDVYVALNNLRTRVYLDVNTKIKSAARLLTINPMVVQPALAMAYDLYEDVNREDEIVRRNKIRHPGFVPANPIKVLSV